MAVDFEEALLQSLLVTTRAGQAHFDVLINNMGADSDFRPRGYFAQVQDITERRRAEADLTGRVEVLVRRLRLSRRKYLGRKRLVVLPAASAMLRARFFSQK